VVVHKKAATVGFYTPDGDVLATVPVGNHPHEIIKSPDGKLLYLTNSDGNKISIIDTKKKQVVGEIETNEGPGRIAITPDGKQLVYNLQAGEACGFADTVESFPGEEADRRPVPDRLV
jgi:YVTN family beta-propeller protein